MSIFNVKVIGQKELKKTEVFILISLQRILHKIALSTQK